MSETPAPDADDVTRQPPQGKLPMLAFAALGIVFGDIGTSPLYTFKTILGTAESPSDPATVLGALSLVVWTLFIITTVKYVSFAMRVDNDGEGGILALMALLGVKKQRRPTIVAVGLFGAALIYGDGAITPAISVLSALEGLNMATPALQPYVVPAAVAILLALFAIQSQGTAAIGRFFGPIMLLWFLVMAVMGISGIVQHPAVFAALNPVYGLSYLSSNGATGFLVLGAVFLCVTGAEALYADMGHFGSGPIKMAWFAVVFPSLILNYAGQAALVLEGAPTDGQHLLPAVSPNPADTPDRAGDHCDHHRQPVDHHRRVLDDAAGDPARLDAATADQPDLLGRLRADLRRRRQLAVDDRDGRIDHRVRQVGQSGGGLRHRRFGYDADDLGVALHCDARDLGLEHAGGRFGRGAAFWSSTAPSSSPISARSPRADMSRCSWQPLFTP